MLATAARTLPQSGGPIPKQCVTLRATVHTTGALRPEHTTAEGTSTVQHRNSSTTALVRHAAARALPFALLFGAALAPAPARADTAYIIDQIRVPLRETPCNTCAVVQQGLKSGDPVKTLETGDGWTRVETGEHVVGWLPTRYLSAEPVARDQLAALREENQRLQAENQRLLQGAPTSFGAAAVPPAAHAADSALTADEAEDLRGQNQALLTRNKMLQSEIDVLHATKEEFQNNDVQRWFVFGGLLVALGALLGTILPLLKPKRRGYSEWN